ncbi:MAG TPA: DUF3108 domain-containing protein [Nitrosomonas sp.]|nr:DUF3108 domain-containing protein [Nitrosomonas sp.]HRB32048.1 DUF3108 domain-containing protein [Nitrosomonas sp.]HRB45502.1 DUF3108 domain-containing protein [Nitrosomonas sp.]HRB76982.1 DUF3108 domain-containing protein [Nitrosomonas sp.]
MRFLISFFSLLTLSFSVSAANIPIHIELNYQVSTDIGDGEIQEVMEIKHNKKGSSYVINSEAQATGVFKIVEPSSLVRHSEGILTKQGLRPLRAYERHGKKEPNSVTFDWENMHVTLKHKGEEIKEKLPAGAMDRLSMSYSFIFVPPPKDSLERTVVHNDQVRLSHYKITQEPLKTAIGELHTIVVTRQEEQGSKLKRKIWLAPDYNMVPVRIVSVEENGREIDKIITQIHIRYSNGHCSEKASKPETTQRRRCH